jgi:hypothetical protein
MKRLGRDGDKFADEFGGLMLKLVPMQMVCCFKPGRPGQPEERSFTSSCRAGANLQGELDRQNLSMSLQTIRAGLPLDLPGVFMVGRGKDYLEKPKGRLNPIPESRSSPVDLFSSMLEQPIRISPVKKGFRLVGEVLISDIVRCKGIRRHCRRTTRH